MPDRLARGEKTAPALGNSGNVRIEMKEMKKNVQLQIILTSLHWS